ncbi:MAG: hypothetical protein LKM33_03530 [Bacteroidales bacterium]|jgi:predicted nucleic acid-binding protein|nr:hypothetical protein [Bacteroidales bacterium]
MMNILIDTCVWFAFFNESDGNHRDAVEMMKEIDHSIFIVPYPTLYEALNTRFVTERMWMNSFIDLLSDKARFVKIEDTAYLEKAYGMIMNKVNINNRPLSLVDLVLRLMIEDQKLNINAVFSFNVKDFEDICRQKQITIGLVKE